MLAFEGACQVDASDEPHALVLRGSERPAGGRPPGGFINNGLNDPDIGGFDPDYALDTTAGLDGAALGDPDRLLTARYVVECALSAEQRVTKEVDGSLVEFEGALGLAPQWRDSACDQDCRQWVSACVLARTNVSGQTVMLWLQADHPALGTDPDPDYPHYEASFFGDVFADPEQAYLCPGLLTGPVFAQLEGRTCSNLVGGWCDFTTYLGCELLPTRCAFTGSLLSPTAVDCKAGELPSSAPFNTISSYVAAPL
ncbi:MAG: hypothetical protein AAGF11_26040 [Myxococcota bacterium]